MMVGIELVIKRLQVSLLPFPLSYTDSGQVVHMCTSATKQYNLVLAKGGDALWLGRQQWAWQKVIAGLTA